MIDADAVLQRLRNTYVRRQLHDARRRRGRARRLKRIRIGGIADHVPHETAGAIVEEIGNRDRSAAIVEDARTGADDVRLAVARRVSE